MNRGYAVLSAIGPDRVGIVDDVTSVITRYGCNIEESRMMLLGGEYAVIMLLDGEADRLNAMTKDTTAWDSLQGLHITIRPTKGPARTASGDLYHIETISLNTPGVVHAVTTLLREREINIIELESDTSSAPFTGTPLFTMRVVVRLADEAQAEDLQIALLEVGRRANIEAHLRRATVTPAVFTEQEG